MPGLAFGETRHLLEALAGELALFGLEELLAVRGDFLRHERAVAGAEGLGGQARAVEGRLVGALEEAVVARVGSIRDIVADTGVELFLGPSWFDDLDRGYGVRLFLLLFFGVSLLLGLDEELGLRRLRFVLGLVDAFGVLGNLEVLGEEFLEGELVLGGESAALEGAFRVLRALELLGLLGRVRCLLVLGVAGFCDRAGGRLGISDFLVLEFF